jgi:hypothetical protein
MRGKMKASNRESASVKQQHEAIADRNKLAYLKDHKKVKAEHEKIEGDLDFLGKVEGKFDPFTSAITGQTT